MVGMRRLFLFLISMMLLAACASDKVAGPSRFVHLGNEHAHYTFDDANAPWDVFASDGNQALFQIDNGVLQGAVIANRGYIWSLNHTRYNDVAITATVRQTQGSRGNGFGVMCRANQQGDGY